MILKGKSAIRPISTGDTAVDKALDAIRDVVALRSDLFEGRLIEDVQLTSGITSRVPHKLGRKLKGYVIVRCNTASVTFSDSQNSATEPDKYLHIRPTGGSPLVSILVF